MSDEQAPIEIPAVAKALKSLKFELLKVAKSAKYPAVVISAEALPKVAKAIDPTGRVNSVLEENGGAFFHFLGVSIVSKESGEAGIRTALEKQYARMGEAIDFWANQVRFG